ncbi:hypothetical protein [Paenibacillus sp. SI8]|uniref:hypothetical protein n=1 Tax=unclassified Paenibacillus TaxID=185978 RepID=UPI00346562F5
MHQQPVNGSRSHTKLTNQDSNHTEKEVSLSNGPIDRLQSLTPSTISQLQRTIGNRGVTQLMQNLSAKPTSTRPKPDLQTKSGSFLNTPVVQRKLTFNPKKGLGKVVHVAESKLSDEERLHYPALATYKRTVGQLTRDMTERKIDSNEDLLDHIRVYKRKEIQSQYSKNEAKLDEMSSKLSLYKDQLLKSEGYLEEEVTYKEIDERIDKIKELKQNNKDEIEGTLDAEMELGELEKKDDAEEELAFDEDELDKIKLFEERVERVVFKIEMQKRGERLEDFANKNEELKSEQNEYKERLKALMRKLSYDGFNALLADRIIENPTKAAVDKPYTQETLDKLYAEWIELNDDDDYKSIFNNFHSPGRGRFMNKGNGEVNCVLSFNNHIKNIKINIHIPAKSKVKVENRSGKR